MPAEKVGIVLDKEEGPALHSNGGHIETVLEDSKDGSKEETAAPVVEKGNGVVEDEAKEDDAPLYERHTSKREIRRGRECPYLDTIHRQVGD